MPLYRITEHVRTQNWTAVGLDFVDVIIGMFTGAMTASGEMPSFNPALQPTGN